MINLGLVRITKLLTQLSKPTWTAIHIAGTNGKGSIAAYLSSLFIRLAKVNSDHSSQSFSSPDGETVRIGRFTSPHLIDRWDCITINDQPVSKSQFLSVESHVKSIAQQIESQFEVVEAGSETIDGTVTEFELLTATAFELFTRQKCQVAVIECGLGGRLDATNAIKAENVAVSVIARIGLDHQNLLGDTVELIAREKAGIIKRHVPVVMDGMNSESIKTVVAEVAKDKNAQIWYSDDLKGDLSNQSKAALNTNNGSSEEEVGEISPSFSIPNTIPNHQRQNLSLALLAFSKAVPRVPSLQVSLPTKSNSKDIVSQVLRDVSKSYQGRLQHLRITSIIPEYAHEILLDGAHNAQSAKVLREYVDGHLFQQQKEKAAKVTSRSDSSSNSGPNAIIWIIAMSRGKSAGEILDILLQNRPKDKVIATNFSPVDGMPWVKNESTSELARIAREVMKDNDKLDNQSDDSIVESEDIVHALKIACRCTSKSGSDFIGSPSHMGNDSHQTPQIVVAGSLYLVSDLLRVIRDSGLPYDDATARTGN